MHMRKKLNALPTILVPANTKRFISRLIAVSVGLSILTILLYQSLLAFPSADDFCYGERARAVGAFQNVINYYIHWTGRFFSTLLIGSLSSSAQLMFANYYLVPLVIIGVNGLGLLRLLRAIGINNIPLALVLIAVLLAGFSWTETIFWLAGGITYGLASALFLILVAEEFTIFSHGVEPSAGRLAFISIGSVLLAGFNEIIMVAHFLLVLMLFLFSIRQQKARTLGIVLFFSAVGAVISIFAPGNFVRGASFPEPKFLWSVLNSLSWLISNYAVFMICTLIAIFSLLIVFEPQLTKKVDVAALNILIISLLFGLWAAVLFRYYSFGRSGPVRTHTVDTTIIVLICTFIALLLYLQCGEPVRNWLKSLPVAPLAFIVCILLRPTPDSSSLASSLSAAKDAYRVKQYMDSRFVTLANSDKGASVELVDLPNKRSALTFSKKFEIRSDPTDWRNICLADYFGLKEVGLRPKGK